jgi:DNA-binding CsgD family transcriptional regulator
MREVFELRRKDYMSNKEIATRLSLSEHTVATQIKKALKVIRLRFGGL